MFDRKTVDFVNEEHQRVFERTRHLPGWQDPGDTEKLYELGYHHGDRILEIGVYGGRSAVVELLGALANPERREPPQFLGVDLDIQAFLRSHRSLTEFGLQRHAAIFVGTLQELCRAHAFDPTMVFVDGDHTYEGARSDLEILRNLLQPGVPVLCHDYTNSGNDTGELGVRRAVDEFVREGHAIFEGVFGVSAMFRVRGSATPRPDRAMSPPTFEALRYEFTEAALTQLNQLFDDLTQVQSHTQARLEKLKASHAALRSSYENLKLRHHSLKAASGERAASLWSRALRLLGVKTH